MKSCKYCAMTLDMINTPPRDVVEHLQRSLSPVLRRDGLAFSISTHSPVVTSESRARPIARGGITLRRRSPQNCGAADTVLAPGERHVFQVPGFFSLVVPRNRRMCVATAQSGRGTQRMSDMVEASVIVCAVRPLIKQTLRQARKCARHGAGGGPSDSGRSAQLVTDHESEVRSCRHLAVPQSFPAPR